MNFSSKFIELKEKVMYTYAAGQSELWIKISFIFLIEFYIKGFDSLSIISPINIFSSLKIIFYYIVFIIFVGFSS